MAKNTQISSSLKKLLEDFKVYMLAANKMKEGSIASYIDYLKAVEKFGGNNTITWLNLVILQRAEKPIAQLEKYFEDYLDEHPPYSDKNEPIKPTYISKLKSALRLLGEFVFRYTNADVNMSSISLDTELEPLLCQLVAQSAIFCSKEVFENVKKGKLGSPRYNEHGNDEGAWYGHKYRRAKANEKRRVNDPNDPTAILDDNTYANKAIKYAICEDLKKYGISVSINDFSKNEFEACHIWDETCYNKKYHTSVANLVLLPRSLASLTDHCDAVKKLLQYEAWERFKFKPKEECYYEHYHEENITPSDPLPIPRYYKDVNWKYPIQNESSTNKPLRGKAKKKQ